MSLTKFHEPDNGLFSVTAAQRIMRVANDQSSNFIVGPTFKLQKRLLLPFNSSFF